MVIKLDMEKAFARLEHIFIENALQKLVSTINGFNGS